MEINKIKKGDIVKITCNGVWTECEVRSTTNWGTDDSPNWYIECVSTLSGLAAYWKQQIDGGTVEMVKES